MNVLYTASRSDYPALAGAIRSLLDHNPGAKVTVFAEDDALPFPAPAAKVEVVNVAGQEILPGAGMDLMRFAAAELLSARKMLYLDVDTVVCGSLDALWATDLRGRWLAWVPELRGGRGNAGVLLMNLTQWRKDDVTGIFAAAEALGAQELLNALAPAAKTVELPVRFNECERCGRTDRPAIVHFEGHPDWATSCAIPRWELRAKYAALD